MGDYANGSMTPRDLGRELDAHKHKRVEVTKTREHWARMGNPMPPYAADLDAWTRFMLPEDVPCNWCGATPAYLGPLDRGTPSRIGQAEMCEGCHDIEHRDRMEDFRRDG